MLTYTISRSKTERIKWKQISFFPINSISFISNKNLRVFIKFFFEIVRSYINRNSCSSFYRDITKILIFSCLCNKSSNCMCIHSKSFFLTFLQKSHFIKSLIAYILNIALKNIICFCHNILLNPFILDKKK
jgi:hypothetical protein